MIETWAITKPPQNLSKLCKKKSFLYVFECITKRKHTHTQTNLEQKLVLSWALITIIPHENFDVLIDC
jgi:hypothetical protein